MAAGDVAEEVYCKSLVERAVSEFGRLDILVNNAAMQRTHKLDFGGFGGLQAA
jgi:NAD(P)-dependent dehydrogenase (short-subunit alcohol dehydrogenase family)